MTFVTPFSLAAPPQNADPELAPWFRSQVQPDNQTTCCDIADGHILSESEWRVVGDEYQVKVRESWVPVPPTKVIHNGSNPTGGAVVWYRDFGGTQIIIFCFVKPAET